MQNTSFQGVNEGRAGPGRGAESGRAAEFARARRHSRFVRTLRIGLPLAALVLVGLGVAVAVIARSLPADLAFASTSIENGRLVMQDPRLTGTDSDDRPYSMVANRAIQSADGSGVDLEVIRAEVAVDDETTATIVAGNGYYDLKTERMRLFDDIAVNTTSGIQILLPEADIDVAAGRLDGNGAVTITTPGQRLEAGSVSIEDGGRRLSFAKRVKLTLLPNPTDETASN